MSHTIPRVTPRFFAGRMAVKLYASDGLAEFAGANTVARMNLF